MREANWDDIFQRRSDDIAPQNDRVASFLPWEEWLTFLIVAIGFMSVVQSIDSANWVDDMPSLYPIGFAGLLIGYALARVRVSELALHPLALLAGATLVFLQLLAILPGGTPAARTDGLLDRMHEWWAAATSGGISNDGLPFIVLILVMVWLGAYVSSWAIFRWRNPWLGLVPGGTALMWNISFIPGQFSYSFVVFVFAAVLLLMRVHVANREADWDRRGVAYPEFISLSVLHATFWVTVAILLAVWIVPLAERSDSANERWANFTSPLTERFSPLGRVFIGVNAKRPIDVHNLDNALALQGKITLNSEEAVEINVDITPEMAAYLRAQSFDQYTADGWKVNVDSKLPLDPGEKTDAAADDTAGARQDVTVNITVKGNNDNLLYSVGQPVTSSEASNAETGDVPADVSGLRPSGRLGDGDTYSVTGSVSLATIDQLRAAGTDYPDWVQNRYLQLPHNLPTRVARKAAEVSRGTNTPYDAAAAIERYLRTFPESYDIPAAPPGRDSVDYFLFDAQEGYFDYHASAMAVMLRTLGVPARVATGYVIDPAYRQPDSNIYKLTEKSAYAWPEVYFPGVGWVEFNPTPSQPNIFRPGTPLAPSSSGSDFIDPRQIPPDDEGLLGGLDNPKDTTPDQVAATRSGGGSSPWPALITLAAIGAIMAVLVTGGRLAWEFGLGGLSRPAQLWEKTQRLAKWGKAAGPPSETPREFAWRLRRDVDGAGEVSVIASAYERTRFGQKALSEDETERLESAWVSVRNTLLRRVLRLRTRR
jgi:transglutaminase-like putative cysteine protease